MRIGVPKEMKSGELRVALVPDIISKLTKAGLEVVIESNAGLAAEYSDKQFSDAGAEVKSGDVLAASDVVLSVQPLTANQMKTLKKGSITISFLSPSTSQDSIDAAVSGCTDKTTSLPANTSPLLISAPASLNCLSEYSEARPAFDSIITSKPAFVNLEIISGTKATRSSPDFVSFGTAIRICLLYPTLTLLITH